MCPSWRRYLIKQGPIVSDGVAAILPKRTADLSSEEASVDEASVDEASVDEASVDEASVDEASVESMPANEAAIPNRQL